MKIKICGIKREDEVAILNQFPVTYAGFIFAKSKRQVTIDKCLKLSQALDSRILKVGVFVDAPLEEVLEALKACKLDVIQLHGSETVDYIKEIPVEVWKTLPIKSSESLRSIKVYDNYVQGILFETYHEKLKGGTGKTFDWHILENIGDTSYKKILAGGLNPGNALEAIKSVSPHILDMNSGLEVDGFKTYDKVKQLFDNLQVGQIKL